MASRPEPKTDVLLDLLAGDCGKGKITDYLADDYDAVVRFHGGNNAGHTIKVGDQTYKLHLVPSGVVHPGTLAVIANGAVVDPFFLTQELDYLTEAGIDYQQTLKLSDRAHIILPYHRALDCIQEARRSAGDKIGTTKRGISPCVSDKVNRKGLRVQDLLLDRDRLEARLHKVLDTRFRNELQDSLDQLDLPDDEQAFIRESLNVSALADKYHQIGRRLAPYICDTSLLLWRLLEEGKSVLCEGAQGVMLDLDHGNYEFVTSSNILPGAVNIGTGIPVTAIRDIYGVIKSFPTRVDSVGPFPTYDTGAVAEDIIERGLEFGTTTGRRRRLGWPDNVALRYAARLTGVNKLAVTKLDVLSTVKELKIATAYRLPDGSVIDDYPSNAAILDSVEPVYQTIPGWDEDISKVKSFDELPEAAKNYLQMIADGAGVEITLIGVGQERSQIIECSVLPR